jgi:hypothetical protein
MLAGFAAAVASLVFARAAYALPAVDGPGPIAAAVVHHAGQLVSPVPALATSNHPDAPTAVWSEATALLSGGDDVRALLDNESVVRGRFRKADDDHLTLAVGGTGRQLSRAQIVRLSVTRGTRQRRHEMIGMAAGAVLGAWIWNRQCGRPGANCQEDTMLYFGGPMFAGGAIGHVLPRRPIWRDIYIRP